MKNYDPKKPLPKVEEEVLKFWQDNKIFEESLEARSSAPRFVFYDGPPFANGLPHYGHILAMTIKDTVLRFKTMQGFCVPRRGGWDTHGLPVEFEVEKELGISGKPEIEKYGVEKFNQKAKESVMRYRKEWEKTIERMGRWIDWEHAYTTMDRDYMESVWWVFKQIYDKGLVYDGFKSLPYCPRCGTPLSNFELNQGYKDNIEDPSVHIKFAIDDPKYPEVFFLAWTTTPWTLPGNMALAVGENVDYVLINSADGKLILAKERLSEISGEYKIEKEFKGKELIGLKYKPLYDMSPYLPEAQKAKAKYQVFGADFVSTDDGTGIVHIAPAFGEDDLELAKKENIAIIQTVDGAGIIKPGWGMPGEGKFVKEADKIITEDLKNKGLLYKEGTVRHTYPFCWRCDTVLIYYAMTTWFISVSKLRDELVKNNDEINWVPEHVKVGRFGKWLEDARDWAISRNRFWGAPIPIWQCEKCQKNIVIGSLKELEEKSGKSLKDIDLHKPSIDEILISCDCGGRAKRIPEVLDCWFESGSMPYAQQHYPFDHKDDFEKDLFPADFIAEGLDQTRGWFYTLHVIATILFGKPAFKNCVVNGIVLSGDGKKLSKRLKNYDEPEVIFNTIGVDPLRYFLLSSTPMGEDYRFSTQAVQITLRKVILPLLNSLSFLTTYAAVEGWTPGETKKAENILDKWILSRLGQVTKIVTDSLEEYDLTKSSRQIGDFVTDLSQWYVRRSRKRSDKKEFYQTLYEVLKNLSIVSAPFMPFISEEIWQNLRLENDAVSVHLSDWPKVEGYDEEVLTWMQQTRALAEKGLSLRAEAGIRVRQPLAKFEIDKKLADEYLNILKDEINVKEVTLGKENILDTEITPELKKEGIERDLIRLIQDLRKAANLRPGESTIINWSSVDNELKEIIEHNIADLERETNCKLIQGRDSAKVEGEYNIDAKQIWLGIK